ncbi:uncharacterized protein UV8b_01244 [Ustilaginoidea virens]|uniref:Biotin-protein ligase N-terminal domain-containing protein n=1 Tax=Ustilaginoidea virens TaxID=1159556 RepID=A0A1B5L3U2_USTVR|nr:uncharacterized protein UV8b_01244 [Ustilaginoidea virens]QUC17003.1 hypothetical protein UV8b_01244 [Ustilaginoidea virens]GAO18175.1 hypothetical protein UVI_02037110 [Ustilaginoidea virens]
MYPPALLFILAVALGAPTAEATQPLALVYRGPSSCKGCSEAAATLLQSSPQNFSVTFVGPNEGTGISADVLSKAAAYVQPGGPDLTAAYNELQDHAPEIRDFVNNGGRYLGFCLGAFLAGNSPGFDLLPSGASTDAERKMDNSQVTGTEDTIIQVDWTFRTKVSAFSRGETAKAQWIYFQDGAVINGLPDDGNHTILGRYSQNGNVAASLTPYGKGWVAVTGPHPEAPKDWYKAYRIENPDGMKFDIGYDFVNAAMEAGPVPTGTSGTGTAPRPTTSEESAWNSLGRGRGRITLQNPIGWLVRGLTRFR